jgi:hypothetical protein
MGFKLVLFGQGEMAGGLDEVLGGAESMAREGKQFLTKAKRAGSVASRKWQAVMISQPPPMASPLAAAMTGTGNSVNCTNALLIIRFSRSAAATSG